MSIRVMDRRVLAASLILSIAATIAGCGSREGPAPAAPEAGAPATAPTPVAPAAAPVAAVATDSFAPTSWTPEAMEELLAPIALYPDPVLSQMLIASTNPQEVLDAGNWLLTKEGIKGKALDDAAAQVGFTPPIRALVQFPETLDMMCLEMGWTTELGEAFTADQPGVLDAIQRLRKQAREVGNLQSSEQMLVETAVQEGKEVVVLKPAKPDVVYVPQYDPQTAYAPIPATAVVPATTTTTTTTAATTGHSTGSMVATGVLAFGAGILVAELFDDDDDDYRQGYYYPNYGYGGMPYYPPYPYRPSYGSGFYPNSGYNRPPNYNSGFQNNGNIYVNTGGGNRPGNNNDYWDRYDGNRRPGNTNQGGYNKPRNPVSPITAARPNRPELNELNKRQPRAMPADVKPPSADATVSNWKGQSGYAGKKPGANATASERIANASPGYSRPASAKPNNKAGDAGGGPKPKVQGSYAGASDRSRPDKMAGKDRPVSGTRDAPRPDSPRPAATPEKQKPATASRDVQKPKPSTRDVRPSGAGDRGYGSPASPSQRPQTADRAGPKPSPSMAGGNHKPTAMSGASRSGSHERAASQRGKQSMPQGARSKGGGGSGGGKQRAGR